MALLAGIYAVGRGWIPGDKESLQHLTGYEFDRWIAGKLEDTDVVQALPGCGLRVRRTAKERFGALTVCDSGTSHERFQAELLRDEAARWNVEREAVAQTHLQYVESEYDEADLITAPSRFACNSFIAMGMNPVKVALTPYGADLDEYQPTSKNDSIFRILFVGSICIRKGVPYLLKAVSQLNLPNAELCIRGVEVAESKQLLRLYTGRIPLRIVPAQPRGAMRELFNQASVVVLPSVEDGFGLVIGQAMACGVPVIASENSGGPELIHQDVDGFVIPARDIRALRDALTMLYESPMLQQQMGNAARATMERIGGWRRHADTVLEAYVKARRERAAQIGGS